MVRISKNLISDSSQLTRGGVMFRRDYVVAFMLLLLTLSFADAGGQQAKDIIYTTDSPEAMKAILEGIDLMDNFRYSEAAVALEKAVKADPNFAIAYDLWGATASTTEEALRRYNKAFELAPKASEPERLLILSDKALFDNKPDMAEANLRKIVELLPDGKRAHYYLALFLQGQQKYPEAEGEYNKVIMLDPNFAAVYNNYAYFLSTLDRYPEAIRALQKYAELKPLEPNPHDSMGEIYLWMGDYDNSMKEYSNSLKLDSDFVASIAGLGHNHVLKGEFDKARIKYAEMLKHAHNVGDTNTSYYWEAVSYLHENKHDAAIAALGRQADFAKTGKNVYLEPTIHDEMAVIYREKNDLDKAIGEAALERQLAQNPAIDSSTRQGILRGCLLLESGIFARQGKPDQAREKLEEYLKAIEGMNDPSLMRNYHAGMGIAAYFNKDYQTAIDNLKLGDQLNQNNKYYLGLAYEMTGQKEQAKKIFAEIAKYNRNSMTYAIVRPAAMAKM
jgi:tetratricopeptide (TPR) repeat protein